MECLYCDFRGEYPEVSSDELVKSLKRPVFCLHNLSNSCNLDVPILRFEQMQQHCLTDCDGINFARGNDTVYASIFFIISL